MRASLERARLREQFMRFLLAGAGLLREHQSLIDWKTYIHYCGRLPVFPRLKLTRFFPKSLPRLQALVRLCLLPIVRCLQIILNLHPYHLCFRFITLPFLARDPKAIEIVQVILESILLRRDKNMRDVEGNKIVDLPPKEVCSTRCLTDTAAHLPSGNL